MTDTLDPDFEYKVHMGLSYEAAKRMLEHSWGMQMGRQYGSAQPKLWIEGGGGHGWRTFMQGPDGISVADKEANDWWVTNKRRER